MMTPKVSVIIPCYNIEQHLSKCIESILAQSFDDFELLLINDGSTDQTGTLCEKYVIQDSRIKLFHQANAGVSAARNLGLQQAVGDLLIFIDGDDFIKQDYIMQLVSNYVVGSWPICGMINVRNRRAKENENFSRLLKLYPEGTIKNENYIDLLKYSSLSSPCARIYDKSVILKHNIWFDEEITYQEDVLFNLMYVRYMQKVSILNYYGYYYIEHPASSTGRYHRRFNHLELLTEEMRKLVKGIEDDLVVKEFIFQTALRQISNIFHKNALIDEKNKIRNVKYLLYSQPFLYAEDFIFKSKINMLLKLLLKIKNPHLIYHYYKKLHR